ncbi:ATP-binding protein, partial [Candidatus Micrarchaeota archaeon]|nr:ATP-binding protein [Candidatus Micrarchaeota archaeon]
DFIIQWQPSEDKKIEMEQNTFEIFEHLFYYPLKHNKPCVVLVTGKSGTGKSETTLKIIDKHLEKKGIDFKNHVSDVIIMNPKEYADKLEKILYDKDLKKIDVLLLDEARILIGSDNWQDFCNKSIGHMNATSRAIKPLMIFIVTQSIMDISKAIRRTIDYELCCTRPTGQKVRIRPRKYYIEDADLEKPRLRWRRIIGTIIDSNKRRRTYFTMVKFSKVRTEIRKLYDVIVVEAKKQFIDSVMQKTIEKITKSMGVADNRVEKLETHLKKDHEFLDAWGELKAKRFRLKPNFRDVFSLTKSQTTELEKRLSKYLIEGGKVE